MHSEAYIHHHSWKYYVCMVGMNQDKCENFRQYNCWLKPLCLCVLLLREQAVFYLLWNEGLTTAVDFFLFSWQLILRNKNVPGLRIIYVHCEVFFFKCIPSQSEITRTKPSEEVYKCVSYAQFKEDIHCILRTAFLTDNT